VGADEIEVVGLFFPIVFKEPPLGVMVVIEAPVNERLVGRVENKGLFDLCDLDEGHVIGLAVPGDGKDA
jgi:hypothetical protein